MPGNVETINAALFEIGQYRPHRHLGRAGIRPVQRVAMAGEIIGQHAGISSKRFLQRPPQAVAAAESVQQHDRLRTLAALQSIQGLIQEEHPAEDSSLSHSLP